MKNPIYNRVLFVLSFLGLLVAGFLWYKHATHGDIPCGPSGGCEIVASSRYARFPVGTGPYVAMWGTLGYLGLVALTFLRTLTTDARSDRPLLILILLAAGIGSAFSLWLTWTEVYIIKAICRWCVTSQALILAVFVTGLIEFLSPASRRSETITEPITE